MIWIVGLVLAVFSWRPAGAHEVRPGYLELRATAIDRYQVLWKQPALGEMRLKIDPVFPADCALVGERIRQLARGRLLGPDDAPLPGGAGRQDGRNRGARGHPHRRAGSGSARGRPRADGAPEAEPTELFGVRRRAVRRRRHLFHPGRRAHPAGCRSPALRLGVDAPRVGAVAPLQDDHGLHPWAQPQPGARDLRHGERARPAAEPPSRSASSSSRPRSSGSDGASNISRAVIRGSWPALSASCMDWGSQPR